MGQQSLRIVSSKPLTAQPSQPTPTQQPVAPQPSGGAVGFAREAAEPFNPVSIIQGLLASARDIPGAVQGMGAAQGDLFRQAQEAAGQGDYATATRNFINYLLPLVGPQLDRAGDLMDEGRIAEGAGATVGVGLSAFGPAALGKARGGPAKPFANANPVEQGAVDFARQRGIPVDAATATANPLVRGAQWMADRTVGGSVVGNRARRAQETQLRSVGDDLANQAHPAAVTQEAAGLGMSGGLRNQITTLDKVADTHYGRVRAAEADPRNMQTVNLREPMRGRDGQALLGPDGKPMMIDVPTEMALPVDLRGVKTELQPIYDRLRRQMPVTQQEASRGMKALENIVNGPDYAPLSVIDMDLSAIKTIARSDIPELRNLSQGTAAGAVHRLDAVVRDTAKRAGVLDDLIAGRQAHKTKVSVGDLYDEIKAEGVGAFRQAAAGGDAGIGRLREIAKHAPDELPKIGRAFLDTLMEKAKDGGGFNRTAGIYADWQKLGPDTKRLLFKDPQYIKDLDNFFLFAKKAAENPNPSGSGYAAWIGAQGSAVFYEPVSATAMQLTGAGMSKLLWSPTGVRLLTDGFRLPSGNRAAAAAYFAQVARIAGAENLQPVTGR